MPTDRSKGNEPQITSFDGLVAYLSENSHRLSKRLNQVAKFILSHPDESAIYSVIKLADLAGVPSSTFTRFSKELGFGGFSEFQDVIRPRLLGPKRSFSERAGPSPLIKPGHEGGLQPDLDNPSSVFDAFVHAGVETLERLQQEIDRDVLLAFVEKISVAPTLHIISARGAFGVGTYCFYGFSRVGKHVNLIDNLGTMRSEQLRFVRPGDVALAITFDDYTPETISSSEQIAKDGHCVLCITDNEMSPIARFAQHSLFVREGHLGHFRLQLPAMALCQSLIVSVGRRLDRLGVKTK